MSRVRVEVHVTIPVTYIYTVGATRAELREPFRVDWLGRTSRSRGLARREEGAAEITHMREVKPRGRRA